ncbi:MAG TPA: hypothetical protein VF462_13660 [Micromonosporaceae bacterium]
MRGELDDALARLARREELQRRRSGEAHPDVVLDEVADALRQVVAQHPGLAVTATVHLGATSSTVRVAWSDGSATVTAAADVAGGDPGAGVLDEPVAGRTPYAWPLTVHTVPPSAGGRSQPGST